MSTRMKWFAGSGAAAVVAVAALVFGVWYFVLRDDSPPPVSLDSALDSLGTATATPTATTTAANGTVTATLSPTGDSLAEAEAAEGGWIIDTSLESFVGYRVGEELAGIGTTTAVGRTPAVAGSVEIEGGSVVSASIEADMTQLESDESRRDNALRGQALETNAFPTATFELTEPVALPDGFTDGETAGIVLVGNLTLHGVTRAVEIPAEAQLSEGIIVAVGSLDIVFADYDIDQPRAAVVLSVEDHGTMEFQLFFTRDGGASST